MQLIQTLDEANLTEPSISTPTVLTIGTFDGLHRGHQLLISRVKASARRQNAQAVVMAFHPRPKDVLAPHLPHNDYLTTPPERIALLEQLGVDILILIPFTLELARISAADFMRLLVDRLNLIELWAGHDFKLGRGGEGDLTVLTALGQELGYTVHRFEPLLLEEQIVSSTNIRRLLQKGQIRRATAMLGRYPSLSGQVAPGAGRGRTIGIPTANLAAPPEQLIPANGVYATFVLVDQQRLFGVTNIGIRPSFDEAERTVETYILDFEGDLYGQQLTLEFVERIRPEKKFDGVEELVAQIKQDAARAGRLLAQESA